MSTTRRIFICLATLALVGGTIAQGLTIWTTFGDATLAWLEDEAASFAGAFGVETTVVALDLGELKQRALVEAAEGAAGDVFVGIPHDQIPEFALAGVAADMRSFATRDYLADLSEQARVAYTFGGELVGLPMFVEGPALVVNDALVDVVPQTYEDLVELARALTDDDTFGFLVDAPNFYFAYGWIHTFGGYVFGVDARGSRLIDDVGLDNEGAVAGARALKALRFEHALLPEGTEYAFADGRFLAGAAAMIYNGPWAVGRYRAAGIDVSVHPMPPLADGSPWSGFMGVEGVLLNPFSTRRADAANFAKWITRTEAQVSMATSSSRIPASLTALALVDDDPIVSGFGRALLDADPLPSLSQMSTVWGPAGSALDAILASADSDVAEALARAAARIRGD